MRDRRYRVQRRRSILQAARCCADSSAIAKTTPTQCCDDIVIADGSTAPPATERSNRAKSPWMRGINTCVSGSPKRALNSMTRGPVGRPHQTAIQYADVLFALGLQSAQHRREDLLANAIHEIVGKIRGRRIRAHAAGIRSGIAVAGAFVIARRGKRHDRAAVAQCKHADFASCEHRFQQHVAAAARNRSAVPLGEHVARGIRRSAQRRRLCRRPNRRL